MVQLANHAVYRNLRAYTRNVTFTASGAAANHAVYRNLRAYTRNVMFTASGAAANHAVYRNLRAYTRNVMFTGICQEYRDCHRLGLIRIQGKDFIQGSSLFMASVGEPSLHIVSFNTIS